MPKVDANGKRLEASKFTYGDKDFKDYKDFEATYRPYAEAAVQKKISEGKKIPVEVLLSQAYIESDGGRSPLNNNLSGLKASKSETNYGLYETTEFHKDEDYYKKFEKDGKFYADSVAFPPRKPGEYREIVSTKLVEDENSPNYGKYRYRVQDYFSHSNNVQEGFEKVIDNFYVTPDYKTAVTNDDALNNPEIFLKSISGNYATEGGYYDIVSPYLNVSMETSKKTAEEKAAVENKTKEQQVQDTVDKVMPEFVSNSVNKKPLAQDKVPFSMFAPKMKNGGVSISGNVNAEGKELILKNSYGDYAIIPKNHRAEVMDMVKEGCNNCIDSYVSQLPKMHNYAKDGTVIHNPDDYEAFNKFRTTLPKNLKETKYEYGSPDNEYDLYGYWESFNKPKTFGTMLFQNPDYKRQDDGMYHGISRNPKTGQLLKSPSHKTFTLGVHEDRTQGYQTYYGKDGKMYSHRPGEIKWDNFDKPYIKAANGLVIGGDLSKLGSKVKPSADANTSNAPTSTIQPVNPNVNTSLIGKTWDDIPSTNPAYNQPQLKQDTRTDYEREQDQKAMEDYQNPNFIEQLWSGARMVPRAIADPIQGVGQIFDAVGLGDTRIGQDLGNFNDEEAAYRYRNVNPNMSAGEKFMGNLGEGSEVAAWGATNFIPFESAVINPIVKGLVGKGNYSSYVANQLYSPVVNQGVKEVVENSIVKQVDDVIPPTKTSFQVKEMPGLHLQSTMENGAISKIVDKTGKINTEQAFAIIAKESGGAEKLAIIKQGFGDNIPSKMDFNDFRRITQEQLIPLEKQFSELRSDYGIGSIGYDSNIARENYILAESNNIENLTKRKKDLETSFYDENKNYGTWETEIGGNKKFYPQEYFHVEYDVFSTAKEANENIRLRILDLDTIIKNSIETKKIWENKYFYPLENKTMLLSNKGKFGKGSSAHSNPDETLGHIHFLRDAETPDVLTVTQIQSDAFQSHYNIFDKENNVIKNLEAQIKYHESMPNRVETPDNIRRINAEIEMYKNHPELLPKKNTQKELLAKNHQERYLQELVDYAGKRGDVNKVRVPTSETAAKVQGYSKVKIDDNSLLTSKEFDELVSLNEKYSKMPDNLSDDLWDNVYNPIRKRLDEINKKRTKETNYSSEHQTILKKYSEQPKNIKKLFGEEPKLVTDSKGNTWYEFDIPKKFKEGKGEIKAFTTIPVGVGTAGAIGASQQKNNNTNSQ